MGLDALWQQCVYVVHHTWFWLRYEAGVHPLIFLGVVIVFIGAIILYKTEVRNR
jgi:hypothetical protein